MRGWAALSNKNFAVGTLIVLVSFIAVALVAEIYLTLQAVNPIAALAAVTVVLIGIAWLKKTTRH
jgi:hypothetical protein